MEDETWGDVADWETWQEREAAIIAQDICARNYGRWPVSLVEWQEAAARYGLHLHIVAADLSEPAVTLDTTIVVRHTNKAGVLQKRICHEIAEAVAYREGAPRPFQFDSPADEHHNVARLVERGIASYMQKEKQASLKREKLLQSKRDKLRQRLRRIEEELQAEAERLEAAEAQLD